MTTLIPTQERVSLHFTRKEEVSGLLKDVDICPGQIWSVAVVNSGPAAAKALRVPGVGLAGYRRIGTRRGRGTKALGAVCRGEPALVVELSDAPFDRLLISDPRAREYADRPSELTR